MKSKFLIIVLLSFIFATQGFSQKEKTKKISLRGKVINFDKKPIESVQIFVDFVKTSTETSKRGLYKLKVSSDTKLITVYSPKHGYINWQYTGEKKIDFVFPEFSEAISETELAALGYTLEVPKKKERNWYGEYSTVLEILDKRFTQVRLNNGQIIVGRGGPHSFSANKDPLILLDNIPIPISSLSSISTFDIKSIRVIHKGSELAEYGFQGNNGVIHIDLKKGGKEK